MDEKEIKSGHDRNREKLINELFGQDRGDKDYIDYDEYEEAQVIIIPIEDDEDEFAGFEDEGNVYSFENFSAVLSSAESMLSVIGERTILILSKVFAVLLSVLKIPFVLIWQKGIKPIFDKLTFKAFYFFKRIKSNDFHHFREDSKTAVINAAKAEGVKETISVLKTNTVDSFKKHKTVWKGFANVLFPVACLAVLIFTISHFSSGQFVLKVQYNDKDIGYIKDESVFNEARDSALEKLSLSYDDLPSPTYSVAIQTPDKLSSARTLCEKIIENTGENYVSACGIYIDGNFLCAVRSEADAISIFDDVLTPYKEKAGRKATVAFVEEITYVQGFFADNEDVIWSADKLEKTITEGKSDAVYYTVKLGDTFFGIAYSHGMTESDLQALNPTAVPTMLRVGQRLLISPQVNYIRVKVMKQETRYEYPDFETITKETTTLYKGTSRTAQNGRRGKTKIVEMITYIDDVKTYSTKLSSTVVRAPVNKIILKGTKEVVTVTPTPTYTSTPTPSYTTPSYTQPSTQPSYSSTPTTRVGSPMASSFYVSSSFGYRSARISGRSFHGGIDLCHSGGSEGIGVLAALSGTVVGVTQSYSGYGYSVLISHGNGLSTRYAHMQAGSITVRVGQSVSRGQQIGRVGHTGNATGPHLHFEVIKNGVQVNPYPYLFG